MLQEKKTLTAERKRELLEKELQGSTRLMDAVRKQIDLYEGDMVKLRNERYEIEHKLSVIEKEEREEKEKKSEGGDKK